MVGFVRPAPCPSGKGGACKASMHRFDSGRRLRPVLRDGAFLLVWLRTAFAPVGAGFMPVGTEPRAMSQPAPNPSSPRAEHDAWLNSLSPKDRADLLHRVTARQARLSLSIGGVFLVALLAIPIVNAVLPALAARQVAGFPLAWLVLGLLFYPLTWLLSALFIRKSNELEYRIAQDEAKPAREDVR